MAATEEPVLTNISEMIDLAIGTPENGVVDFNMLQTVLHCLAQQMRILGKNVELRGGVAVFPVGRLSETSPTIAISEFIVDTGDPGKYELATSTTVNQASILVVERKRRRSIQPSEVVTSIAKDTAERKKSKKSTAGVTASSVTHEEPPTYSPAPPQAQSQASPQAHSQAPPQAHPQAPPQAPPQAHPQAPSQAPQQASQQAYPQAPPHAPPPEHQPAPQSAPPPPGPPSGPSRILSAAALARSGPIAASTEKLSLVTLSKFNLLESAVEDLKNRVYGTSPKNEEILQEVRSQSNLKAITEMWTNMNVSSRLDAAEEAIGKLSSLIEDLIKETTALQNEVEGMPAKAKLGLAAPSVVAPVVAAPSAAAQSAAAPSAAAQSAAAQSAAAPSATSQTAAAPSSVAPGLAAPSAAAQSAAAPSAVAPSLAAPSVAAPVAAVSTIAAPVATAPSTFAPIMPDLNHLATKDELGQVVDHLQNMRDDIDKLNGTFSEALKEINPKFVPPEPPAKSEITITKSAPSAISRTQQAPQQFPQTNLAQLEGRLMERIAHLERELKKCCDNFKKSEGRIKDQVTSLQDQLEYLSKQASFKPTGTGTGTATATATATAGGVEVLSPDLIKDLQGLMKLFETVQSMQDQLKQVHETALSLAAEKEARQNHIDALLEQIELLKVIKLDREDMVEALADKADLRMLARKVSHDQFVNACDDLSKGLEHALGKLNIQESLWQQALDDIQREIEQKLDKMELSPVKDFFNSKLKQLQEHLRQMADLRREAEAAGTKRRLLREVNCISCDAKAVMQMDAPPPQPSKPLPAHLSMKPYLSYELDTIRKNQASALPQRNMRDWENVHQQMQPSKPRKVRSADVDKHLCNRYCGGSHTTTTPAQRVARLGHFIKQWGPEVLPLSSGFAAGDDGRLYKITTSEPANVGPDGAVQGAAVCTPKSTVKRQEPPKDTSHAIAITAECRCLDPTEDRPQPQM